MDSSNLPRAIFFAAPAFLPDGRPGAPSPKPAAPPPGPEPPPRKGGYGWAIFVLGALAGAAIWTATDTDLVKPMARPVAAARVAVVRPGALDRSLRVTGTIAAEQFVSIRAPQMRGPRDAGRNALTLMKLAPPGSMVNRGDLLAVFELKWLEDHIDDVQSQVTVSKSNVEKRRAEQMIVEETDRQALLAARAEYDKAMLNLRTAEVRSEIEAEILKNLAQQAKATAEQLAEEIELKKQAHAAEIRALEIKVAEDELHLDRHARDFARMTMTAPLPGLVVMEPMYQGGGQITQTKEGDQVYPGALFMRIVDLREMVLRAAVNQADVQAVRIGQKATVRLDAYPELTLEGKIVGIGAMATESSGGGFMRGGSGLYLKTVPVDIAIHTSDPRVIPDLSGSADIAIAEAAEGLLAPREAIRRDGETAFVYVRGGQQIQRRDVELGDKDDTHVIVLSGVGEGEEILLEPPPAPKA